MLASQLVTMTSTIIHYYTYRFIVWYKCDKWRHVKRTLSKLYENGVNSNSFNKTIEIPEIETRPWEMGQFIEKSGNVVLVVI